MFWYLKKTILTTFIFALILLFLPLGIASEASERAETKIVDGILDLEGWDFAEDGIISLSGEWEFYWEKLLIYSDFQRYEAPQKTGNIKVPGDWNGYLVEGEKLKGFGYATYRLTIKNLDEGTIMGLKSPGLCTAYNLWVNDKLLSVNGLVSVNPEEGRPSYNMDVAFFLPESSTVELIIQVSNYHHRRGGFNEIVELGTAEQIHKERNSKTNDVLFLFGSLLILAFYNLGYYYFNRKELTPLYFSLFCVAISLRVATTGEIFIKTAFPNINWQLQVAIEYISLPLAVMLLIQFFRFLYPEDVSRFFARFMLCLSGLYTLFVIVTPVRIFSYSVLLLMGIAVIPIFYMFWAIVKIGFINKREGSLLVSIGFVALTLTGIIEILKYFYIIEIVSLFNYGIILFVFTQSMTISIRFIKAYLDVETMSRQLKEYGVTLEAKVKNRTEKLQGILKKLRYVIVNETDAAINMLSAGSQELAAIAGDSKERAIDMKEILSEAGMTEQKVSERVAKGVSTIENLEKETAIAKKASDNMEVVSQDIVAILEGIQVFNSEIKSISKQVKLLAINAGIEAARAGKQGLSFAVVAEEVKKLSAKTYNLVEKIDNQTLASNKKLKELGQAVSSVSHGIVRTEETVETTNEVYNEIINAIDELSLNLQKVIERTNEVADDSENISLITQEQASTTEEFRNQTINLVDMVKSLESDD